MGSFERSGVYNKIVSLEDKVNRLEEIISYGNREDYYSSTQSYHNNGVPSHYNSAIRLSKATQNFKQDLLQNPYHNKLSRENYKHIYNRVSALEKELDEIVQNMNYRYNRRSDYDYYEKSQNFYDSPYQRGYGYQPRRRVLREPPRKRVTYDKYIEEIVSDTSSSESIEEIIYYVESSTTSSSDSSVIVEEYVPKRYTKKSVRKAPLRRVSTIDVSKSKPRSSEAKSSPVHIRKCSPPGMSISKQPKQSNKKPKVRKSKKEKRKVRKEKQDLESDVSNEENESEIFLVKRSKDSPTKINKTKNKKKKEKYFVSRLKKVESSDEEQNNNINQKRISSEQKSPAGKKFSDFKKWTSKDSGSIRQEKRMGSQEMQVRSKKSNNRKAKKEALPIEQSTETITAAHGSLILNDPFVRTIYYDDLDSLEEETKTNCPSNIGNSNIKQDLITNKVKSNIHNPSVYEMSNSIYSFDPFLKRKEKVYPAGKLNDCNLSQDSTNIYHKNQSRIHNVNKNDIIILNDDKLMPHQQKFTFKQRNKYSSLDSTVFNQQKKKE